ncbi:uncharacterized protein [Haliotis asinina]|uniref:uncharacterized protein n=1 Tax=Haliotis asinina TaxID=109174 RepID=UPI003532426F
MSENTQTPQHHRSCPQENAGGAGRRADDSTAVDDATLVHQAAAIIDRLSQIATQVTSASKTHIQKRCAPPTSQEASTRSRETIREALQRESFSKPVEDIILQSWRNSTHQQYGSYLQKWMQFCNEQNADTFSPSLQQCLEFLASLYKKGLGYSAINTARSTLSTIVTVQNIPLGQHPIVTRFMKGVYNLRPALPRNKVTWDVSIVIGFLKSFEPESLQQLSMKLATLLLLLTGQRTQALHMIDQRNVEITDNCVNIRFGDLLKQSRPGYHQEELTIPSYPDKKLCLVTLLRLYLCRTEPIRGNETALFISTVKPYHRVSKDTIARWVKMTLTKAGINMRIFTPHSIRSASTTKASMKVPLSTILNTAGWSSQCTFAKFYKKPISNRHQFSEAVMA